MDSNRYVEKKKASSIAEGFVPNPECSGWIRTSIMQ
jgi:hypothetical protein